MAKGPGTLLVDVYVSDLCDRDCWYCQFTKSRRGGLMGTSVLERGLALAKQWPGVVQFGIAGTGEPLANPILPELASMVARASRRETTVFFTSGSASEEEDSRLLEIERIANQPLEDGKSASLRPILKYDGTGNSAQRIRRSLGCHFLSAVITLQCTPGTQDDRGDFGTTVSHILLEEGYCYLRWNKDPRGGLMHTWSRDRERLVVKIGDTVPIGPWVTEEHRRFGYGMGISPWYSWSDVRYWALHPDGSVSFCENSPHGLLSVNDYGKLDDMHRDLLQLWTQFHRKDQRVRPYLCNTCPIHLGTARREAAT
jgi:hypothetical protein